MKWLTRILLIDPERVARRLRDAERAGLVPVAPNPWQVTLGVLRMWHRLAFRSETVGLARERRVRPNRRAALLAWRPLRFPFLLAERAVAPWDLSGLLSSEERLVAHLLGAHHDEQEFVYDLQLLRCRPGALERLRERTRAILAAAGPRAEWLRDLCVFEGYHERLLEAVEGELAGASSADAALYADPDRSLSGYLQWCAAQPPTPEATYRAWAAGTFPGTRAIGVGAPIASPGHRGARSASLGSEAPRGGTERGAAC